MADVRPFRALRPRDALAARVIAPPYDVLTPAEASALAADALNFVHVTRSEVDLPPGTSAHSATAYARARANLDALREQALQRDPTATFYLYRLRAADHVQVGFLAACSVEEYANGKIRRHEHTRPDKEEDRMLHMESLEAQVGPVFLAYRGTSELDALAASIANTRPAWQVATDDGVEHTLWMVPDDQVSNVHAAFQAVPALYIADGHHRSAAAERVDALGRYPGSDFFLAGIYPADQLRILAYNRVVRDLNGHSLEEFLTRVDASFDRRPAPQSAPTRPGTFTMFLGEGWFELAPRGSVPIGPDPVSQLDVSVLQDHLLGPILGIDDPRRSARIEFIGGIRGPEALERAVHEGAGVAFHLYPTPLEQLFAVTDAGEVMPPKSTWFEPKLREGVAIRVLDEATPGTQP